MKKGFRQSMTLVHTWSGLVVSWVLFFIFLTGTLGYVDTELDRWMRPALPIEKTSAASAARSARQYLEHTRPDADRWFVGIPTHRDYPNLYVFWSDSDAPQGEPRNGNQKLDVATARAIEARATGGGQTLYRMHYTLHYMPRFLGEYIVGICTMLMLVAIITGIVIHKKIFKDFFTFRPRKGQRSWLDFHNLLSVAALPFHLMITYSGLIFFAFAYMPLVVAGSYGWDPDNREAFVDALFQRGEEVKSAGVAAPLVPLEELVSRAEAEWGTDQVRFLSVRNPGDANARVEVTRLMNTPLRSSEAMIFQGATGELLARHQAGGTAGQNVRSALLGLHEGLFAGPWLRVLYFLSGLAGTAMIATGLILWTVKRQSNPRKTVPGPGFGHRLVERLNLGTIVGLPMGIAVYFWANRLLPLELTNRDDWEVHCLFITWLAALIYGCCRPVMRAWIDELKLTAALFGLLPIINTLTTERGFFHSLIHGDWFFVGFDLSVLAVALFFFVAAKVLRDKRQHPDRPTHRSIADTGGREAV